MASPTIRGWATATNSTDASPTVAINLPTRVAGDALLAFVVTDTNVGQVATGAWTVGVNWGTPGALARLYTYSRIATNDTNDNLSILGSNNNDLTANVVAITVGTHGYSSDKHFYENYWPWSANGTTGNVEPMWGYGDLGQKDWLCLAVAALDMTATGADITADPSGYTPQINQKSAASTSSVGLRIASKNLTGVGQEDPGPFTNTSGQWVSSTILFMPPEPPPPGLIVPGFKTVSNNSVRRSYNF